MSDEILCERASACSCFFTSITWVSRSYVFLHGFYLGQDLSPLGFFAQGQDLEQLEDDADDLWVGQLAEVVLDLRVELREEALHEELGLRRVDVFESGLEQLRAVREAGEFLLFAFGLGLVEDDRQQEDLAQRVGFRGTGNRATDGLRRPSRLWRG